jgi:ABC-type lipoprotein release transport system permease subunit
LGLGAGWSLTRAIGDWPSGTTLLGELMGSSGFLLTLVSTPVLAVVLAAVASWIAAAAAAAQDAAVVLQGE